MPPAMGEGRLTSVGVRTVFAGFGFRAGFGFAKGRTLLVLWEDRRAGGFCFAEAHMLLVLRRAGRFCSAEGPTALGFVKGRTLLVLWEDRRAGGFCFAERLTALVLRRPRCFWFCEGPDAFGFALLSIYVHCSLDSSALSSSGFTVPQAFMPSVMVTSLFPHTYDFYTADLRD
jgi:hypothetical protein